VRAGLRGAALGARGTLKGAACARGGRGWLAFPDGRPEREEAHNSPSREGLPHPNSVVPAREPYALSPQLGLTVDELSAVEVIVVERDCNVSVVTARRGDRPRWPIR
jgi:hypothetical protein